MSNANKSINQSVFGVQIYQFLFVRVRSVICQNWLGTRWGMYIIFVCLEMMFTCCSFNCCKWNVQLKFMFIIPTLPELKIQWEWTYLRYFEIFSSNHWNQDLVSFIFKVIIDREPWTSHHFLFKLHIEELSSCQKNIQVR